MPVTLKSFHNLITKPKTLNLPQTEKHDSAISHAHEIAQGLRVRRTTSIKYPISASCPNQLNSAQSSDRHLERDLSKRFAGETVQTVGTKNALITKNMTLLSETCTIPTVGVKIAPGFRLRDTFSPLEEAKIGQRSDAPRLSWTFSLKVLPLYSCNSIVNTVFNTFLAGQLYRT